MTSPRHDTAGERVLAVKKTLAKQAIMPGFPRSQSKLAQGPIEEVLDPATLSGKDTFK